MAIEIFNRQELKFIITMDQFEQLLDEITLHTIPDTHNKHSQPYRLFNLYIDTLDHALIRHSTAKPVVYKEKLRIRSYTDFTNNPVAFLEVKKRYKRITNKRRTKIPYDEALSFIKTGVIPRWHDYMNKQVIRELESMLQAGSYSPKTFITYDRRAFTDHNQASDLRVTFDTNVIARRYDQTQETPVLATDRVIMEIKSSHNVPLWLVELLTKYGIRKQGFSKYGEEYLAHLRRQPALVGGSYA